MGEDRARARLPVTAFKPRSSAGPPADEDEVLDPQPTSIAHGEAPTRQPTYDRLMGAHERRVSGGDAATVPTLGCARLMTPQTVRVDRASPHGTGMRSSRGRSALLRPFLRWYVAPLVDAQRELTT
jgi:hypothetical protein